MYCSKCGGVMAVGAAFCSNCGQAFAVAAVARGSMMSSPVAAPIAGGVAAVPAYAGYAAVPRVQYAGFWVRFLALLIDNAVMGIGFVLILIPLIFLTGLGGFIGEIHRDEDMNDVGIFMLFGLLFLAATVSLLLTWLYHALMESSEWRFGRATGRHFAKIITNMVPAFIGYIMAGFTERKQALHDMIAGCLVRRNN